MIRRDVDPAALLEHVGRSSARSSGTSGREELKGRRGRRRQIRAEAVLRDFDA